MVPKGNPSSATWDKRLLRYMWNFSAVIGIVYMVMFVLLRQVVPLFVEAPITHEEQVSLEQYYTWNSFPDVERATNDALLTASSANAYPGCMTYATCVTQRGSTYRLSNVFVYRCPDCVAKVNIVQVDYAPDGTQDTALFEQLSPDLALGLWPWEKTAATLVAAEGGI